MDKKKILLQAEQSLLRIEQQLYNPELEKIFQRNALCKAFFRASFKEKFRLVIDVILKKMGVIPVYSIDEYREDFMLKKEVQELRNNLAVLANVENWTKENKASPIWEETIKAQRRNSLELSNKLKTGYIAVLVNTLDKGGVEQVIWMLVTGFIRCGIEVRVLCLQSGGLTADKLIQEGVVVKVFQNNGRNLKKYILQDPPLLINTHFFGKYIRFFKRQNIPVVEVIHNMYVFFSKRRIALEIRNEKYFTKLVAVSDIVKETYCSRIKASNKIVVIGNAASQSIATVKDRIEIRKQLGIPENCFVMLSVGSIDSRKNQIGIVQAFEIMQQMVPEQVYLVLAGNVQDQIYERKLKEKINQVEEKKTIKLLPFYENISELYCMADILVIDSYYEGWSIAATEALYEGLPIIHSECGSARELTDGGRYGIMVANPAGRYKEDSVEILAQKIRNCENRNVQELVGVMLSMYHNRERWAMKRECIRSEVRNKFSEDEMLWRYIEVFERLI